jgi:hypothetical protein
MGRSKINIICSKCEKQAWTKGLCSAHYKQEYYVNNRDKESTSRSEYNKSVPEKMAERKRKREQTDVCYKLANRLRHRLNSAIKGGGSIEHLGCTVEEFKVHLENMFEPGMSWNNHTTYGWHIDHIIPLSKVDLKNEADLKKVCHYKNLRPLWWDQNLGRRYGKES